jgi:hypothetical protein
MSPIFVRSEVDRSRLYQENIGDEFTHLCICIFIVLRDHRDLPQPWTP